MVLIFIWIISDYRVGDCLTDQMSISAPGSTGSPVICGYNSGQHSNFKLYLYPIHNYIYNNCIFQWFWTLLVLIVKVSILTLVAVHLPLDNGTFLSLNTLVAKRIWEVLPDAYNTIQAPQGSSKSKLVKMIIFGLISSQFLLSVLVTHLPTLPHLLQPPLLICKIRITKLVFEEVQVCATFAGQLGTLLLLQRPWFPHLVWVILLLMPTILPLEPNVSLIMSL